MIKNHLAKRPFSTFLSLNDIDSTFQRIQKSPVDMTIMRAVLFGSQ